MNLDYSQDEKELKSQLRRFLQQACPPGRVRATLDGDVEASRRLTAQLAELGWLSTAIPEIYGGQGLSYVALCGVAEEIGRVMAPTSFGSSIFLAAEAVLHFGSEHQKKSFLPALAAGTRIGVMAVAEAAGPLDPRSVSAVCDNGRLTGDKIAVIDGMDGDIAIVTARSADDVRLFAVELNSPQVVRTPQKSVDPSRPLAKIRFSDARAEPLGEPGAAWNALERVLDRAAVLFAFEQLGGADKALELARDYALTRHAFGRPIGAFQAIKHKLAEVYIANELARANAYFGAWALEQDSPELKLAAATARVAAIEAFERAARELMQTHGGIAATWDHDCHLYYRRARHLGSCIGSIQQWRNRLAQSLASRYAA